MISIHKTIQTDKMSQNRIKLLIFVEDLVGY